MIGGSEEEHHGEVNNNNNNNRGYEKMHGKVLMSDTFVIQSNKTSKGKSDAAGVLPTVGAASCYNTTARLTVSLEAIQGKEKAWFLSELSRPTGE